MTPTWVDVDPIVTYIVNRVYEGLDLVTKRLYNT